MSSLSIPQNAVILSCGHHIVFGAQVTTPHCNNAGINHDGRYYPKNHHPNPTTRTFEPRMSQTTPIGPDATTDSGTSGVTKLWIFWTGRQMCPELAQKLEQEAPQHGKSLPPRNQTSSDLSSIGYLPVVCELDCAVEIHKLREPVAIVAATYDGESLGFPQYLPRLTGSLYIGKPWFNARNFFDSLTSDDSPRFEGVKYSVFGCGLDVFPETYQYVPKVGAYVH
jgi:hypothetical protein